MLVTVRRSVAVVVAAMALTACGGGADPEPKTTATEAEKKPTAEKGADEKSQKKAETVPAAEFDGVPAPEVLSEFACAENDKSWQASGVVTNPGKDVVSYQVTVQVGPADGQAQTARTVRLADVAAGSAIAFEVEKIPVQGAGPCHVQVLQLDD